VTIDPIGHDALIGQTFGHYRIIERIGGGGMGVVYRAHDEHLDRQVAIKVLPLGTLVDETARRRFRHEALTLSKLNHPNIATIHDFDTQQGLDFLVMEYIPGVTLSDKLAEGSLPEKQVVALGTQLGEGLSAAHEHAVVHRDLKPGNLRLTSDGRLKILDFGLAKLRASAAAGPATETLSETHMMAGTLPYMAPEQVLGGEIDARTDIHAAGAVLCEMCTGRRPFARTDSAELVAAILRSSPTPATALNPKLSSEMERIIGKCLEKDQENRYQSAKELVIDLRRLGTPSGATEVPRAPKPAKEKIKAEQTGAYRALTRLAVLIPLLLVIGVLMYLAAGAIYQNRKAQWAREIALPKAQQLISRDNWDAAYALAVKAEKYIPNDPQLKEVLSDSATLISVKTEPSGADVFLKPYGTVAETWQFIGRTPIQACRISRGFKEYKITKSGYDPVTGFTASDQRVPPEKGTRIQLERTLTTAGTAPSEMVNVDAGKYKPTILYFRSLQSTWVLS
jgi:eukaryotic-like serine/threonine-protein kinase